MTVIDVARVSPKAVAYHEAAHAVFSFIVIGESRLSQIKLTPALDRDAALYAGLSAAEIADACLLSSMGDPLSLTNKRDSSRQALCAMLILQAGPAALMIIPDTARVAVADAILGAFHHVFLTAAGISILAFIVTLFLDEIPLQQTQGITVLPALEEASAVD